MSLEQILTWSNVNFKGFPEERFLDPPLPPLLWMYCYTKIGRPLLGPWLKACFYLQCGHVDLSAIHLWSIKVIDQRLTSLMVGHRAEWGILRWVGVGGGGTDYMWKFILLRKGNISVKIQISRGGKIFTDIFQRGWDVCYFQWKFRLPGGWVWFP